MLHRGPGAWTTFCLIGLFCYVKTSCCCKQDSYEKVCDNIHKIWGWDMISTNDKCRSELGEYKAACVCSFSSRSNGYKLNSSFCASMEVFCGLFEHPGRWRCGTLVSLLAGE